MFYPLFLWLPKSLFIDSEFQGGKIQPFWKISFHLTPIFARDFRVFEKVPLLNAFWGTFLQPVFWGFWKITYFCGCVFCDSVIALMESIFLIFCGAKIEERQKLIFLKNDNSGILEKERALAKMTSARFAVFWDICLCDENTVLQYDGWLWS